MSFHPNDRVKLARDIYRIDYKDRLRKVYAEKGEVGAIIEIFRPRPTGSGEVKPPSAKVKMDASGEIKTFRLTSLERV